MTNMRCGKVSQLTSQQDFERRYESLGRMSNIFRMLVKIPGLEMDEKQTC